MNNVTIAGRVANKAYYEAETGKGVLKISVALNDGKRDENGNKTVNFIDCVAFGSTANFIDRYFDKGQWIGIQGRLQKSCWMKDGEKKYRTEVIIRDSEFIGRKETSEQCGINSVSPIESVKPIEEITLDDFQPIDQPEMHFM